MTESTQGMSTRDRAGKAGKTTAGTNERHGMPTELPYKQKLENLRIQRAEQERAASYERHQKREQARREAEEEAKRQQEEAKRQQKQAAKQAARQALRQKFQARKEKKAARRQQREADTQAAENTTNSFTL